MRYFNTAGPCVPAWHYTLPPEPRLPEARGLIEECQYFVVHAPRQTGKTTTLSTLARTLTAEGLRQLDTYLDRLDLHHGTLVVFDRHPDAPPLPERTTFTADHTPSGHPVTLLRA